MAFHGSLEYVTLMCLLSSAISFNLEPRIPVIKTGQPNSYFGFSVAEHRTSDDRDGISWLLAGAPLDQNRQPNTTRSGALWKCPLTPLMGDCDQIVTDGKRTKYGKIDTNIDSNDLTGPHQDEIKDGQWLGVSVRSQGAGRKAIVCAHRYIRKSGESQFGQGLCYTLNKDLQLHDMWEPCRGRPVQREHEEYGFCQVGTSSYLLSDDTLIIGAPGPYTWRGTIFTHDTNDNLLDRDHSVYMAPVEDGVSPVEKYSYLGMSVVGGKFFSDNFSYAAGAPRSRGTGQVVFFNKRLTADWNTINVDVLNVKLVLNGEQFGSSFGYEIACADVNGDNFPDLIVGAPFYFDRDTGGAVYLYLNRNYSIPQTPDVKLTGKQESQYGIAIANAGDLNKDGCEDIALGSPYEGDGVIYIHMGHRKEGLISKPDQIIKSESLPVTMKTFGYALSGGMDLDNNGYPDLLIGAYESNAIALIRTRPIIDIKTSIKPSAIISNIDPSKHGCERDPNSNYTCFNFETCCMIKSLVETAQTNVHRLTYVIEAETFPGGKKYSRVFFGANPTAKKSNIIDKSIDLKKNVLDCREHVVYLKNNTRDIQTPIKFKVTYKIEQSQPIYSTRGPLPDIDNYPVLNATATRSFTANFLNDCGDDDVCVSDMVVDPELKLPRTKDGENYALTLGKQEEIRLSIAIDNHGESAYEAQLFVKHHSNIHYIAVDNNDKHITCTSVNKTIVSCMLENPFKRQPSDAKPITLRFDAKSLEDNEAAVTFEVWANSTSKSLYQKSPAHVQAMVIKNAKLSIQGISQPEQVFYGGEVKGESAMKYFDDIGARVVHTYQIYNEGLWRVTAVRVVISWPHQVAAETAQGKWLLYPEGLPTVEGEHANEQNGECFMSEADVNPLNLSYRPGVSEPPLANLAMDPFSNHRISSEKLKSEKHNSTTSSKHSSTSSINKVRRKRENDPILAEAYTDKDGRSKIVKTIDCQNKTAKCVIIQCVIYKIERMRGATITIRSRLWNSTLIEDDSNRVNHIKIVSNAHIMIPDRYNQNKHADDSAIVPTLAYPDFKITESSKVPSWVIIVSVIVGIIVLIIIIILLWYFGFFKRSRPDFTLSGNLEKNNHESKPFIEQNSNSFL